ncbi:MULTISPECIES: colicin E3/pyocin S6 family cytotoxin [Paenibacillus]|uniref:Colicin E3-like ribonuclease domain-containing protein n=1 Tax=Paenibacillus rigui TaxID=554312 RepID=A0A229UUP8_9BACL|nr:MULTISPECIES: colicin E3/pyocin S6 family cytotoxin [Paenibacillus]OXM87063.1 hypothetical protein CF651_07025 [Paenibacillus rigui]
MKTSTDWTGIPGSKYPLLMALRPTNMRNKNQRIYRDAQGYYYHKDALHSEVEVYDTRGKHLGVKTPEGDWHPKKGQDKRKTLKGII